MLDAWSTLTCCGHILCTSCLARNAWSGNIPAQNAFTPSENDVQDIEAIGASYVRFMDTALIYIIIMFLTLLKKEAWQLPFFNNFYLYLHVPCLKGNYWLQRFVLEIRKQYASYCPLCTLYFDLFRWWIKSNTLLWSRQLCKISSSSVVDIKFCSGINVYFFCDYIAS